MDHESRLEIERADARAAMEACEGGEIDELCREDGHPPPIRPAMY